VAPSLGWLLFCRFLQGFGAALILSCAPALVAGLFREDRRSRALAVFTMMHTLGSACGPLLGGMLVDLWGWPSVFWFRAPIALTAFAFLGRLPETSRRVREPVDVLGAALLAFAISAGLLSLNQLQQPTQHLVLLIAFAGISLATALGFIVRERRTSYPMINLNLFRLTGFAAVNAASFLVYLTSFSVLLLTPYYLVRVTELPLPLVGAVLAASFGGSIAASPIAGSLLERLPAGCIATFGAILSGVGLYLIGGWDPGTSWAAMVAPLVLQGFGVGLFQVAYIDMVMVTLPPQHRGVAGSLAMLTRTLGVVTGAALLMLIFHTLEASAIASGAAPADGFMSAFRGTFHVAGAVAVVAAVTAALLARHRHL
jgi:MFS family permease